LLLHPLYLSPHKVYRFSQHLYRLAVLWVVGFHPVLNLPDAVDRAVQPLCRAQLLLLLLLWLSAFRHRDLQLTFAFCLDLTKYGPPLMVSTKLFLPLAALYPLPFSRLRAGVPETPSPYSLLRLKCQALACSSRARAAASSSSIRQLEDVEHSRHLQITDEHELDDAA
jgi:hypothetical protein